MSKFKLGDLVEIIDKDAIYGGSDLNWVYPTVVSIDCESVIIELDSEHYKFNEDELILYKRDDKTLLHEEVIKFMKDNDISCEETIHQCDCVIENAYEFIEKLFNIVKDDLDIKEDNK